MNLLIDIGEGVLQKIRKDEWCEREVLGAVCFAVINGKEVKDETTNWTPVTKATPRDGELVNITWINHNPEPYYEAIKDKPFTATAYYFKGAWYWFSSTTEDYLEEYGDCPWDRIDTDLEITAWMPLPEPYKEGE